MLNKRLLLALYNYRLPNINAALGLSQLEQLDSFIKNKREIASLYQKWGFENGLEFFHEPEGSKSNYWLSVLLANNKHERDMFLDYTNKNGIMTRPVWTPMHKLQMFEQFDNDDLRNTERLSEIIVNVPSSVNL